jgi:hypothetical protein
LGVRSWKKDHLKIKKILKSDWKRAYVKKRIFNKQSLKDILKYVKKKIRIIHRHTKKLSKFKEKNICFLKNLKKSDER